MIRPAGWPKSSEIHSQLRSAQVKKRTGNALKQRRGNSPSFLRTGGEIEENKHTANSDVEENVRHDGCWFVYLRIA